METNGKSSEPVNPFVPRVPKFEPPIEVAVEENSEWEAGNAASNSEGETDHSAPHDVLSPPVLPCAGQLVVITGATGELGRTIAQTFAGLGADLMLIGRDLGELIATVDDLDHPERAGVLACDLVSDSDVSAAVEFLVATERPVSALIHAAGLYQPSNVASSPVEELDQHYLLNLRGPYLLTQKLIPLMAGHDPSSQVVFLLADQPLHESKRGSGFAHVHVINAAVDAFTEELRVELEPKGIHIGLVTAELISAREGPVDSRDVTPIVETLVDTIVNDGVGIQSLRVTAPRVMRNA